MQKLSSARFICSPNPHVTIFCFLFCLVGGGVQLQCGDRVGEREGGMAGFCHGRDFMLCSLCGNLLTLDSLDFAGCALCGFKRSTTEIQGREIRYSISAEDIRRELKIEPFVLLETTPVEEEMVQRAVVNEACPQCHHPQLEYYTKQLRSADEGQTVFYECPKCGHKFSLNT